MVTVFATKEIPLDKPSLEWRHDFMFFFPITHLLGLLIVLSRSSVYYNYDCSTSCCLYSLAAGSSDRHLVGPRLARVFPMLFKHPHAANTKLSISGLSFRRTNDTSHSVLGTLIARNLERPFSSLLHPSAICSD